MSRWIKRSEQEPPKGGTSYRYDAVTGSTWVSCLEGSGAFNFTHWVPLPDPPPRTVTIEISEEDARSAAVNWKHLPSGSYSERISEACRKALEAKR